MSVIGTAIIGTATIAAEPQVVAARLTLADRAAVVVVLADQRLRRTSVQDTAAAQVMLAEGTDA